MAPAEQRCPEVATFGTIYSHQVRKPLQYGTLQELKCQFEHQGDYFCPILICSKSAGQHLYELKANLSTVANLRISTLAKRKISQICLEVLYQERLQDCKFRRKCFIGNPKRRRPKLRESYRQELVQIRTKVVGICIILGSAIP